MSTAIREFVRDNSEKLLALQKHLKSLRDEIDRKLGEVSDRINVSDQPPLHPVVGPRPYNEEWPKSFTRIRYWLVDTPGESNPAVNLRLSPKGWQVVAFRLDESDIDHLLAAGGIKSEAFQPSSFPRRRLCGELDYDADPSDVATKVQLVIDALRHPSNAPA